MSATKALSLVLFGVGALLALGLFFPRLRPRWRGVRILGGAIGCLGFGLVCLSAGAAIYFSGSLSGRQRTWIFLAFVLGWVLGIFGIILDRRKNRRLDMMQNLQTHLITRNRGDRAG